MTWHQCSTKKFITTTVFANPPVKPSDYDVILKGRVVYSIIPDIISQELLDNSLHEIRLALKQQKNDKAPRADGTTAKFLKAGGKPVLRTLQKLFNSVVLVDNDPGS